MNNTKKDKKWLPQCQSLFRKSTDNREEEFHRPFDRLVRKSMYRGLMDIYEYLNMGYFSFETQIDQVVGRLKLLVSFSGILWIIMPSVRRYVDSSFHPTTGYWVTCIFSGVFGLVLGIFLEWQSRRGKTKFISINSLRKMSHSFFVLHFIIISLLVFHFDDKTGGDYICLWFFTASPAVVNYLLDAKWSVAYSIWGFIIIISSHFASPVNPFVTLSRLALMFMLLGLSIVSAHSYNVVLLGLKNAEQNAIAASQAKSEFIANTSHELRTPLNGVIGMTDMLLQEDTELSEDQADMVRILKLSGKSLLNIINDILDFEKIEAGKLILEVNPFSSLRCVEEVIEIFAESFRKKGVELVCHLINGKDTIVYGDITRVKQILVNLIGNAFKFTEQGEVVVFIDVSNPEDISQKIATPEPSMRRADYLKHKNNVSFMSLSRFRSANKDSTITKGDSLRDERLANESTKFESDNSVIHFAVQDTGVGIPKDKFNRLFKAFSQVDASTTRNYGGTGLGLAICKRLTEMMGGRMWVESQPGQGSRFHFTIINKLPNSESFNDFEKKGKGLNKRTSSEQELAEIANFDSPEEKHSSAHEQGQPLGIFTSLQTRTISLSAGKQSRRLSDHFDSNQLLIGKRLCIIERASVGSALRDVCKAWGLEVTMLHNEDQITALLQSQRLHNYNFVIISDMCAPWCNFATKSRDFSILNKHVKAGVSFIITTLSFERRKAYKRGHLEYPSNVRTVLLKPISTTVLFRTLAGLNDDNIPKKSRKYATSLETKSNNETEALESTTNTAKQGERVEQPVCIQITPVKSHKKKKRKRSKFKKTMSILVAEDNFINQKVIRRMLGSIGFDPDIVGDGQEAVKATAKKYYDLIFMDVMMPNMDGREATKNIRRQQTEKYKEWQRKGESGEPPKESYIVALTASVMLETKRQCKESGMDGFLAKPIEFKKLQAVVKGRESQVLSPNSPSQKKNHTKLHQRNYSTSSSYHRKGKHSGSSSLRESGAKPTITNVV